MSKQRKWFTSSCLNRKEIGVYDVDRTTKQGSDGLQLCKRFEAGEGSARAMVSTFVSNNACILLLMYL